MRSGTVSPRPKREPRIAASASSSSRGDEEDQPGRKVPNTTWNRNEYPTPTASSYGSAQNEGQVPHDFPSRGTPNLETWAKRKEWATPTVADTKGPSGPNCQAFKAGNINRLADQLQELEERDGESSWPTPAARDWKGEWNRDGTNAHPGPQLPDVVARLWPTPTSQDATSNKESPASKEARGSGGVNLTQAALTPPTVRSGAAWPTPRAFDCHGPQLSSTDDQNLPCAALHQWDAPLGPPDPSTPTAGESTSPTGRVLNPRFVEALMGLPIGWTDLGR
jgi:hypothetical protein